MSDLKHIETKEEYKEYQERVARFIERENIEVHSPKYDQDGDIEPSFSWQICECCSRHLGGDRYIITAGPLKGENFDYDICVDCYYYLEYGQLDDMTMMDLK